MGFYNLLIIVNSVGIAFITVVNLKIRKEQRSRGVWRND